MERELSFAGSKVDTKGVSGAGRLVEHCIRGGGEVDGG